MVELALVREGLPGHEPPDDRDLLVHATATRFEGHAQILELFPEPSGSEAQHRPVLRDYSCRTDLFSDLDRMAQITAGFSGADLAQLVNEAALLAVRRGEQTVTMADFDLGIERIVR